MNANLGSNYCCAFSDIIRSFTGSLTVFVKREKKFQLHFRNRFVKVNSKVFPDVLLNECFTAILAMRMKLDNFFIFYHKCYYS